LHNAAVLQLALQHRLHVLLDELEPFRDGHHRRSDRAPQHGVPLPLESDAPAPITT
jgi:hypothetical protein